VRAEIVVEGHLEYAQCPGLAGPDRLEEITPERQKNLAVEEGAPVEASHLAIALVTAIITVAMAYYLKNLRRFVSHR